MAGASCDNLLYVGIDELKCGRRFIISKFYGLSIGGGLVSGEDLKMGQIWILEFFSKISKIYFLFLTFWPKFMALVDTFWRQEDFILWNFLYDNCGKKMSADFSCLFTFFKKKLIFFKFWYHREYFITNSWLWWIFKFTKFSSTIFGGVAPSRKFLKIENSPSSAIFNEIFPVLPKLEKDKKFFLKNVNKQLKSADNFFRQLLHKKFHKIKSS